jgi:acetylornithine deacetylase/succinyl-diaminopimelate desuccinylase-like protein
MTTPYEQLDRWVDAHFAEEVRFLQALVQVPTDTPPGRNAPHAERTAELLAEFGLRRRAHAVPADEVAAYGLGSLTNLIVRRRHGDGPTIALNAHGDVVPPGDGWTHDPYGGEVADGKLYGRASAVSKSDFATYTVRAARARGAEAAAEGRGRAALHLRRGIRRRARPGLAAPPRA